MPGMEEGAMAGPGDYTGTDNVDEEQVVRDARTFLTSDKGAIAIGRLLGAASVWDLMQVLSSSASRAGNSGTEDDHQVQDLCATMRAVMMYQPCAEDGPVAEITCLWSEPLFSSKTKAILLAGVASEHEQLVILCHALWRFYFEVIRGSDERASCLAEHEDVVLQISRGMESTYTGVAQDAGHMLVALCARSERAAETLLAAGGGHIPSLLQLGSSVSGRDEIVALRVLDMMLQLAPFCKAAAVASSGAFRRGIESQDILVRLSYMEVLAAVTRTPSSCTVFDHLDSVPILASALVSAMDPPDMTLLAGLVRALSGIDYKRVMDDETPRGREQITRLALNLMSLLDSAQARTIPAELRSNVRYAMSMLCVQSRVALDVLLSKLVWYCACIALAEFPVNNSECEVCVQGITRILLHTEHQISDSHSRALFAGFGGTRGRSEVDIMRSFVIWVKQPFASGQCTSLELFLALVYYEWGARVCAATPEWLACMTDTNALTLENRNLKLAVLRKLKDTYSMDQLQSWFGMSGATQITATLSRFDGNHSMDMRPDPQVDLATL